MSSKLYSLKEWLTLDDAASHLTSVLAEQVTVSDILQLAIQKRLKLSVNLISGTYANKGVIRDITEARVLLCPAGHPLSWMRGDEPATRLEKKLRAIGVIRAGDIEKLDEEIRTAVADHRVEALHVGEGISETEVVEFEQGVQMLSGIYDLPMLSLEKSLVEEMYYPRVGGPDIDPWGLEGVWLEREGCIYRLCKRMATQADYDACGTEDSISEWEKRYTDPSRWFPADRLPEECAIILRRTNLDAFIDSLEAPEEARGQFSEGEELRALEALGLITETIAKLGPKYRKGDAGKPNCAQIAHAMSQQAGEVYGMSKSKLQRLLSYALDAWEEKRG
ncbi:hypothetical protein [Halomonas saccharevitans]|uniref:Uncharacterized protein n=1 Tax=Halomonas saccharevitans TaxID=416872 RepID=A0A1I6YCR3_9GAMM|nr:hypothetical protein [Halomonas saccharevitans]SFT48188.1 hypothetical protein SAMN04487956_1058 [Halomonas saccharevitans]